MAISDVASQQTLTTNHVFEYLEPPQPSSPPLLRRQGPETPNPSLHSPPRHGRREEDARQRSSVLPSRSSCNAESGSAVRVELLAKARMNVAVEVFGRRLPRRRLSSTV